MIVPTVPINNQIKGSNIMEFVLNVVTLNINRTNQIKTTRGIFLYEIKRSSDWTECMGYGYYHMTQYLSNLSFNYTILFNTTNVRIVNRNLNLIKFNWVYPSVFIL